MSVGVKIKTNKTKLMQIMISIFLTQGPLADAHYKLKIVGLKWFRNATESNRIRNYSSKTNFTTADIYEACKPTLTWHWHNYLVTVY